MEYVINANLPVKAELLGLLSSDDCATLKQVLSMLCPCRNLHYDPEIWFEMARLSVEHPDWYVREAALHAIVTLKDRSRFDRRAVAVLQWLAEHGFDGGLLQPRWLKQECRRGAADRPLRYPKVTLRDVPTLIEALSSDDAAD
ncbi:MAG: hypothetical protein LC772_07290 [Chloroflexi bacterium]|nr:hypothetical protein [Chloroflexota bacterium]